MDDPKLSDLIDLNYPGAVLEEACQLLADIDLPPPSLPVVQSFNDVVSLYEGRFPGYRACSTEYHDLRHTTDTFLTMVRLLHGASLCGRRFDPQLTVIALTASLFHDSGYIQKEDDTKGTGAKHTLDHVERSTALLGAYLEARGFAPEARADGEAMVLCTDLSLKIPPEAFSSTGASFLGRLLMAADLLAQMSDRTYLEKLLFLYHEFKEAGIGDFANELDLLKKTAAFYETIRRRMESSASFTDEYLRRHFKVRWGLAANLYQQAIDRQHRYLLQILADSDADPLRNLKRDGIVQRVRARYGPAG
ncbi:MAG: hypothetical protein PVG78_19040 [Desulfobacterales bacterium]|jgi:hypothetical protein